MRYFIIEFNNKNIEFIKSVIFGELATQRKSVDKKYFVATLCEGDTNDYEFLKGCKEYALEEIKELMKGENWTPKTLF